MKRTALLSSGLNPCSILIVLTLGIGVVLAPSLPTNQAHAADPITSSGLNTQVSQPVTLPTGQTQYNITGGTRANGGTNLFHSFGDFSVPTTTSRTFSMTPAYQHPTSWVASRRKYLEHLRDSFKPPVSGTRIFPDESQHGFLFGPNATVNVGGMATFTTAEYMQLTDGGRFNANPNSTTPADLLTAAPVAAFGS